MRSVSDAGFNFTLLLTLLTLLLTLLCGSTVKFSQASMIEPNYDKPCVVGDAWAEECMSCVCLEGKIATCKPSFCATRLRRDLDDCKEGAITKIDCNTCECKNNVKVCTKHDCGKKDQRRNRKFKRKEKRIKGKF